MNNSIWAGSAQLPAFPSLEENLRVDVLVIGGGLAGLLCAHALERAGVSYALVEADRILHGVSRNTTAKVTAQHGLIYAELVKKLGKENAGLYLKANEDALHRYRALSRTIDCDFEQRDAYVYSLTDIQAIEREAQALQALGAKAQVVRDVPLPFSVAAAVRLPDQAQFNPVKFAAEIAKGLRIYEHTPVRAYSGDAYMTDRAAIRARKAIVTTHFPIFNKHGGYFLKLYQHRSYVIALKGAQDVGGMYIGDTPGSLSFRNTGDLLLLGGGAHRTGKQGGNWRELRAFAKKHYPDAQEVGFWSTQDCMTLDGLPYIGPYSRHAPELFVATGFNKWGMTTSMAAAGVLCDLVQEKENAYASLFAPDRSMLHAQLFKNTAESALHLLTPTRPRCPHLGCALKWNPQERSWDCPCHGSRFARDGSLLDGPATGNL